jgi:hypothetical protein
MAWVRELSRVIVLFVAAAGFLLGQLFTGDFTLAATLAGVGGVLAGALATARPLRRVVLLGCALALVGAALHIFDYYSVPQLPGNYYPWFLTGPFIAAALIIGYGAWRGGALHTGRLTATNT